MIRIYSISLLTLLAPGEDLVKRSASMSYFKTLKHSSLSSRKSAYVRTHAEQSQAALTFYVIFHSKMIKREEVGVV